MLIHPLCVVWHWQYCGNMWLWPWHWGLRPWPCLWDRGLGLESCGLVALLTSIKTGGQNNFAQSRIARA